MPDDERVLDEDEGLDEGAETPHEEKVNFFTKLKAKLNKILGFAIGAILIILISVGISYMVSKQVNKEGVREMGGKIIIPPPDPFETVDFGEFTMNIKGDDEEPHFVRVSINLAYKSKELMLAAEISKRRAQISHIINLILSRKVKSEIDTAEGKENLAVEIREEINQIFQNGKIEEVYFKSITVM